MNLTQDLKFLSRATKGSTSWTKFPIGATPRELIFLYNRIAYPYALLHIYSYAAHILQLITSNVLFGFTDVGIGASEPEAPSAFLCASGFVFLFCFLHWFYSDGFFLRRGVGGFCVGRVRMKFILHSCRFTVLSFICNGQLSVWLQIHETAPDPELATRWIYSQLVLVVSMKLLCHGIVRHHDLAKSWKPAAGQWLTLPYFLAQ